MKRIMIAGLVWLAACAAVAVFTSSTLRQVDAVSVWRDDVKPLLDWDGEPSPPPVGDGWIVLEIH